MRIMHAIGAGIIVATLAACGTPASPASPAAPSSTAAPAASPVSTAATLTGKCVTGWVTLSLNTNDDTYEPASFAPFPGPPSGGYGPHVQGSATESRLPTRATSRPR